MNDPVRMSEQPEEPLRITVERVRPDVVVVRLAAANDVAGRNNVRILLVASARAVLRPLEVTGLHMLFPIFDSVESVLAG